MRILDLMSRGSPIAMISFAVMLALPLSFMALQQHTALRRGQAETGVIVNTASPETAIRALRARLARDALAEAVSLELVDADRLSHRVAADVIVIGPQAGVIAFAERVEANAPVARFSDWRIAADPAGVRLEGTVMAPPIATP